MMTPEVQTPRIAAHKANLKCYAWLLTTELTDLERAFIHKRIAEERRALSKLSSPSREVMTPPAAAMQSALCAA